MIVSELIARLKRMDGDLPVFVTTHGNSEVVPLDDLWADRVSRGLGGIYHSGQRHPGEPLAVVINGHEWPKPD